jgi:hypothetical protein
VTEEGNETGEKVGPLRASWRAPSVPQEDNDYPRGYEDGVRNALREVLSNISKGHSASEIRFLAETRLAHLEEETQERRKSTVVSPRRLSIDALIPMGMQPGYSPREKIETPLMRGFSYLFQEKAPTKAREFLNEVLVSGLPVVAMTRRPQELSHLGSKGRIAVLRIDSAGVEEGKEDGIGGVKNVDANPSSLTGVVKRLQEQMGPTVGIYLDAYDYLDSEYSFEDAIRFVHWLNTITQQAGGILIVSTDTDGMEKRKQVQLMSDFNIKRLSS